MSKSTKTSKIWEKMGNLMHIEKGMGPNQNNVGKYGDLQPIV